jgi:hypothetical protein
MNLCVYETYDSDCVCLTRDTTNTEYKQSDSKHNSCCGTIPYSIPLTDNISSELDAINNIPLCNDWWSRHSTQKDKDRATLQMKIFNKFPEAQIDRVNEYYTLSCEAKKLPRLLEFPSLNSDSGSESKIVCVSDSISKIKKYDFWENDKFNLGYIKNCDPTENMCTTSTPYDVDFYYFSKLNNTTTTNSTFSLENSNIYNSTNPFILGATGSTGNTGTSSNTGLIIGIVIGVIVLLIIIGIILYFVFRKKPTSTIQTSEPSGQGPGSVGIANPTGSTNIINKPIPNSNITTITSTIQKTYEPNFDYNSLSDSAVDLFESNSNKATYSISQNGNLPNFL